MKVFADNKNGQTMEGDLHMIHEHRGPGRPPIPPHERRALVQVEFDEADWGLLKEIFGDEDTVLAAAEIIRDAPPEIQVLAIQLMNMIEEAA